MASSLAVVRSPLLLNLPNKAQNRSHIEEAKICLSFPRREAKFIRQLMASLVSNKRFRGA